MNLHIGGAVPRPGWKILNIAPGPGVDYAGDLRDLSQFQDASLDNVYASHVLEHIPQAQVLPALAGIHRVLRRHGNLMLSVPDLAALCRLYLEPGASAAIRWHAMRMMFGGQTDAHDFHYVGFDEESLARLLAEAGFIDVHRVDSFGLFSDTSAYRPYGVAISLNLLASK